MYFHSSEPMDSMVSHSTDHTKKNIQTYNILFYNNDNINNNNNNNNNNIITLLVLPGKRP